MKLDRIIDALERIAPLQLAEPWDKVGLQIGSGSQNIRRAMLCIDLTEPVLDEAVSSRANLVVAYHPPIFEPLSALTDRTWKQRVISEAVRKRIAVYSPHTALDAAEGGVNDWLARSAGEGLIVPTEAVRDESAVTYKLVTFVPAESLDALRRAMSNAGAGRIGAYAECSFSSEGEGTFRGDESTDPAVGKAGRFERIPERRLEIVVRGEHLDGVIAALRKSHPYEEPPIDVYHLARLPGEPDMTVLAGLGRWNILRTPASVSTIVTRVKKHLGVKHLEVADAKRPVQRVGVCAGAGGSFLAEMPGRPDLFITGEMRHHDVLDAVANGTSIILAGHTQTERPYLKEYRRRILAEGAGKGVDWFLSKADRAPTQIR